jgi:hypothetical protein
MSPEARAKLIDVIANDLTNYYKLNKKKTMPKLSKEVRVEGSSDDEQETLEKK